MPSKLLIGGDFAYLGIVTGHIIEQYSRMENRKCPEEDDKLLIEIGSKP
jgi:hypothetical protein